MDRSPTPNIGPLISRWELDKFKNCWNKSFTASKILTLLYQQFSNLWISQRDMSCPSLGALSNNRWSGGSFRIAITKAVKNMVYAGRRRLEMSGDPADGRHQAALDIFTMAFSNEIPQLNKVIPVLQKILQDQSDSSKKKTRSTALFTWGRRAEPEQWLVLR